MQTEEMQTQTTTFFKILLDLSATKLRIPPLFVKRFGEILVPECRLQVNGKSWDVKIQNMDGSSYFTQGWQLFIKENCLDVGDFLVFMLDSTSKDFEVLLFDKMCCIKEIDNDNSLTDDAEMSENVGEEEEFEIGDDTTEFSEPSPPPTPPPVLSFSILLTKANLFTMAIPKDFALETGIAYQKRIVLVDPNGKRRRISLRARQDGRMKMIKGWDKFLEAFQLVPGVTCTFEFVHDSRNVLQVQLKRGNKRPRNMEY